ncbi:site-specific integrase [Nocardioides sp. GY 10113]|uniref:tyrosine-type recombinase/integrase n=1 Tax=Nocardioides sp. GY 10113 TaxID=2569761 RepID=UPI001457FA41|nr:site-specific integrase [Nocardioides sp. GY 10113]
MSDLATTAPATDPAAATAVVEPVVEPVVKPVVKPVVGRKRQDADPVRVWSDARVAYWPSGRRGEGTRKFERHPSMEAAHARAAALRISLRVGEHAEPSPKHSLRQAMLHMLEHLGQAGAAEGSIKQYRSNWNCWLPEAVALTPCGDLSRADWTRVFDNLVREHASESTVRAVARTLGMLNRFAEDRGYFGDADAFATSAGRRSGVVRQTRRLCRTAQLSAVEQATADNRYPREVCPTPQDVDRFAAAMEVHYPGYGARLILLGYASGLRLAELVAVRTEHIDLEDNTIAVDSQLDRAGAWPQVTPPKGGRTRTAIFWDHYRPIVESLVADALARDGDGKGWLFPNLDGRDKWLDRVGKLSEDARSEAEWPWTFHWLRHAFASVSLAPKEYGGFGLDLASVSRHLGHSRTSTTQDMYVLPQQGDVATTKRLTAHAPGTVPPPAFGSPG